ncbi:hypothetical protein [Bdellovibrio bacteriovorus]|uniref:hypothetical protein n=1 Tax=Bdellovibrio TaxID=958 RepID=UPI0035A8B711
MLTWSRAFLILSCFSASAAFATSKVVVRSEESRWVVEVVHPSSDGWPEVTSRKTFATKEQAQNQAQLFKSQGAVMSSLTFEPLMASGNLWPTKAAWSAEWEQRYAKWIETEVDSEFFVRYNIATDCADVAYSLRWIFARINGLPAAARLGGSNVLMSNETVRSEWSRLPTASEWHKDRRFLAALNYLLDMTYTHTLWDDSFPVALNREALLSGAYHLSLRDNSGHTQLVHWLGEDSGVPFLTLNSTVPRKVRSLMDSMLFADYPKNKEGGLLRFRWAVKTSSGMTLKPATEMPGYSLEQFSFKSQKDFTIALFEKLGFSGGADAIRDYLYKDILEQFRARVGIVEEGFTKCQKIDCKPGTVGWEDWSTPSRDSRIKGKIGSLASLDFQPANSPNKYADQEVLVLEGASWPLKAMIWNWKNDQYVSDPRESVTSRWSAGKESWILSQKKFFAGKVQERIQVLSKGKSLCQKQNCSFGTAAWDATSSNTVDTEIAKRTSYILGGTLEFPAEVVGLIETKGNETLGSIEGAEITLKHLIKNQINMNSSAMASKEEQWALGGNLALMAMTSFNMEPYFDKWILEKDQWRLFDRATGLEVSLGGKVLTAFKNSPVALVGSAAGVEVVSLKTGARNILTASLQASDKFMMTTEGRLVSQSEGRGTQVWELSEATLSLNLLQTLPGAKWKMVADSFLEEGSQLFDVAYLKFVAISMQNQSYFFSNEKVFGYVDKATSQKVLLNRASGVTAILPTKDGEWLTYTGKDGDLFVTTNARESNVYRVNEKFEVVLDKVLKMACWGGGAIDYIGCFQQNNVQFYQYKNGQLNLVASGEKLAGVSDEFYTKKPTPDQMQLFDRKTNQLLMVAPRIYMLEGPYVAVMTSVEGRAHIVDTRQSGKPLFTNVFPAKYGVHSKNMNGDLLLTSFSEDRMNFPVLWKRY